MCVGQALLLLPTVTYLDLSIFTRIPMSGAISLRDIRVRKGHFKNLANKRIGHLRISDGLDNLAKAATSMFHLLPSIIASVRKKVAFHNSGGPNLLVGKIPCNLLRRCDKSVLVRLPTLFFSQISVASAPSVKLIPSKSTKVLGLSSTICATTSSPLILALKTKFRRHCGTNTVLGLRPNGFRVIKGCGCHQRFHGHAFDGSAAGGKKAAIVGGGTSTHPSIRLTSLDIKCSLATGSLVAICNLCGLVSCDHCKGVRGGGLISKGLRPIVFHRHCGSRQRRTCTTRTH